MLVAMPLTLASYNIENFFTPKALSRGASLSQDEREVARAKHFVARTNHLAERIVRADPDVLCIQEMGDEEAAMSLGSALSSIGYNPHLGTPDERGIRNAIYVRASLGTVNVHIHRCDALPFPGLREAPAEDVAKDRASWFPTVPLRRSYLEAEVATSDGTLHVFCLHFKSNLPKFTDAEKKAREAARELGKQYPTNSTQFGSALIRSDSIRSAEALFLRSVIDQRIDAGATMIAVMGDFNGPANASATRIVAGIGAGTLESVLEKVPEHRRYSTLHQDRPTLLDHALLSPALFGKVTGADYDVEMLENRSAMAKDALFVASDHALLSMTANLTAKL
jgi:endonuclease/exonuclease/phosphatase family metal-dependent hydrolase